MSTAKWDAIRKMVTELGRASVRAGVVGEAAHEQHRGTSLTTAEIATLHEMGNPSTGLPRRSFIEATLDDSEVQQEFAALETRLVAAVIAGSMDRNTALNQLGSWMASKIRERIESGRVKPPLQPATVARKGSDIPLIDTTQLLEAIGHEIVS